LRLIEKLRRLSMVFIQTRPPDILMINYELEQVFVNRGQLSTDLYDGEI